MAAARPFSILLVDDDELAASEHIKICGELSGVRVVGVAKNGAEALKLVKAIAPDLVLLDLVMPDVDGFVALRLLMKGIPDTRVAVLSSRAEDPQVQDHCRRSGAVATLMKPLSSAALASIVTAELGRAQQQGSSDHVF